MSEPRMTGIWECDGPPLRDGAGTTDMIAFLRRITEAMPPDAPVRGMTVHLGDYRWTFRRLAPLTLLEGPDGGYAVLNQEPLRRSIADIEAEAAAPDPVASPAPLDRCADCDELEVNRLHHESLLSSYHRFRLEGQPVAEEPRPRHDPSDHDCRGGVRGDLFPLGQPVAEDRE